MAGWQWFTARRFEKQRDAAYAAADAARSYADSVTQVNAARDVRMRDLVQSAARSDSQATLWRRRAQATEAALSQLAGLGKRLGDSLRLVRTAADSNVLLVRTVANLTSQVRLLEVSRDDALRADADRKRAVDSLTAAQDTTSASYRAEQLAHEKTKIALDKSQRALASAEGRCRILPFIPCPSRTTVAIIAGTVSAGVTYVVTAGKRKS